MRRESGSKLKAILLGMGLAAFPSSARACDFHWMLGLPESSSFWSTNPADFSPPAVSTADAAKAAIAQLQALDAQNTNGALNVVAASAGKAAATPVANYSSLDAIGAWKINWTGATGHSLNTTINSLIKTTLTDVQGVWFDANYIYVQSTDVPSYTLGNVGTNVNTGYAKNQSLSLRIPRNPTVATTPTSLGNGGVGVMTNGALMFDPGDAQTYNNGGIWHRVAQFFENKTFDIGPGHVAPAQGAQPSDSTAGTYHYHVGPTGLTSQIDPGNTGQHHSPIIGFAYDGFPIYGPYGYSDPANPNSPIKLLSSSYEIRPDLAATGSLREAITNGGATLTGTQWGPAVGATLNGVSYPAGCFKEDYMYAAGSGDLNNYNMRFEVTPEYPQGTWAYVMSMDSNGNPFFPYLIGPQYYGVVDTANIGPTGGKVTIPGSATKLLAGDANYDGVVNYADLLILEKNLGKSAGSRWSQGNFDANGTVDAADLSLLQANYTPDTGSTFAADLAQAQASVPEPSTAAVALLLGTAGLLRRKRRLGMEMP